VTGRLCADGCGRWIRVGKTGRDRCSFCASRYVRSLGLPPLHEGRLELTAEQQAQHEARIVAHQARVAAELLALRAHVESEILDDHGGRVPRDGQSQ
jgi:hypothetical protein